MLACHQGAMRQSGNKTTGYVGDGVDVVGVPVQCHGEIELMTPRLLDPDLGRPVPGTGDDAGGAGQHRPDLKQCPKRETVSVRCLAAAWQT